MIEQKHFGAIYICNIASKIYPSIRIPLKDKSDVHQRHRRVKPVEVVGVGEACAADGTVGEAVLRVDEKMPAERTGRTEGSPTHRAHVALAVAHHSRVLLKTEKREKNKKLKEQS